MPKTIVVCGYGPGISDAVARRFGKEGFRVALVARHAEKVASAAASLDEAGITARGFACDLADLSAVRALIADVRSSLGPISVIHWNAYVGLAGDLTTCDVADLGVALSVASHGMIVAMQESLSDLKEVSGAILVTGGGFGLVDPQVDAMAVQYHAMGLALAKAVQHKLVGLLNARLKSEGVYVGEVMVQGMVKGTAFDRGNATLEPAAIAERFWDIYQGRSEICVHVS